MQLTNDQKKYHVKNELKQLSILEYKKLFAELPKSVKNVVIVGGGEPLLYKEIIKLIELIKKRNLYGTLITNGSLMNENIINSLIDLHWDQIRISIHAATDKVYQKVNGVQEFDKLIRAIKMIRGKRGELSCPRLSLLFVIQKANYYQLKRFVKMAEELQVDSLEFTAVIPYDSRTLLTSEQQDKVISDLSIIKDTTKLDNNISQAINNYMSHPIWLNKRGDKAYFRHKYCPFVQSRLEISSDGTVVPCCYAYNAFNKLNIRSKTINDIWREYRAFRLDLEQGKFYSFCYSECLFGLPNKNKFYFQ